MAKNSIDCKKIMVEEISSRLNVPDMLIVTNYKGLTSQDLNELRKQLRGISDEYLVVKDSMAKRALADGVNSLIAEFIEGEVGIVIDRKEDPTHVSKILMKFSKSREALKILGGIMNGSIISKEEIATLAALPSRDVLLGKVANVLNAPVQGLASALCGIISKIVYALTAVKDKKQEGQDKGQATSDQGKGQAEEVKTEKETVEKKEAPFEMPSAYGEEKKEEKPPETENKQA